MALSSVTDRPIDRVRAVIQRRGYLTVAVVAFLGLCLMLWPPSALRYDLRVYVVATEAFLRGGDIYTAHHAYPDDMALGFTYPPFAALAFVPFAFIGTEAGRVLMTVVSALSLLAIGLLTVHALRSRWSRTRTLTIGLVCGAAGLALEPVRVSFHLGQINLILTALLLTDLLGHTPRRFRGALVGIATGIKLTPGIFIVFLLVTRRYREAAIASATTMATILAGWLVMPRASTQFWFGLIFDPSRPGAPHFISNQAIRGVFARLSAGTVTSGPYWIAAVAVVAWLGLYAARRAHDRGLHLEAIVLTATTGLLVSPISWTGHWVWALPTCALLWSWTFRTASTALFILTAAWTVTVVFGLPWHAPYLEDREYTHQGTDLLVGNSYTLAAIALLTAALWTLRRTTSHRMWSQQSMW